MKTYLFLLLLLMRLQTIAQTPLSIRTENHCSYSGTAWENELYRFDDNAEINRRIQDILRDGGGEQNFTVIQTNVENVAAVMDNGQRYLLYSLDFIQKNTAIDVYGALAHAIGHHVNQHTLTEDRRQAEETEADFFMGYALFKTRFNKAVIDPFLEKFPSSHGISLAERRQNILAGYNKADNSLQFNSLQADNDPNIELLTLPTFTFKSCYATYNLPKETFDNQKTLGKVDEQLQLALDKQGYFQRSYFSVKNGFALVTQMEQYNPKDASIRNDRTRWLPFPARDKFSSVMDYLTSVILPNKGYFRLFVFVVTDKTFAASNDKVSKSEAAAWLSQGGNRLPKVLSDRLYIEGSSVSVLVYEFEVPQSNRVAKQICPTPKFDARTHLTQAGIKF